MIDRAEDPETHDLARYLSRSLPESELQRAWGRPLQPLPAAAYRLPAGIAKTATPEARDELTALLERVRDLHLELVGRPGFVAIALLDEDERIPPLQRSLRRWIERHVRARLARPNPRDGSAYDKFARLEREAVPWLHELARASTVHATILGELADYTSWLLFQATWAGKVSYGEGVGLEREVRVDEPDPVRKAWCRFEVALHDWHCADDVERVLSAVRRRALAGPIVGDDEALLELESLAEEIRAMRPSLLRGFNSTKASVELGPDLIVCWSWGDLCLGEVHAFPSRRAQLIAERTRQPLTVLRVERDGTLSSGKAPWIGVRDVGIPGALDLNLRLLRAVRGRLVELHHKVDHAALWRSALPAFLPFEPPVEAPAEPAPAAPAAAPSTPRSRLRMLRLNRVTHVLRSLACELRDGPGSELVIYRPGFKHATIGRHTANREVPLSVLHRALRQLGITHQQWLALTL